MGTPEKGVRGEVQEIVHRKSEILDSGIAESQKRQIPRGAPENGRMGGRCDDELQAVPECTNEIQNSHREKILLVPSRWDYLEGSGSVRKTE